MRLKPVEESSIFVDLQDSRFAARYLEEVLKTGSLPAFLVAVRDVVRASGNVTRVATRAKLGRESMYKALSRDGNPQFSTLQTILDQVGLQFSITEQKKRRTS